MKTRAAVALEKGKPLTVTEAMPESGHFAKSMNLGSEGVFLSH